VLAAEDVPMEFVIVVLEVVMAAIWSGRKTIVPTGTESATVQTEPNHMRRLCCHCSAQCRCKEKDSGRSPQLKSI